MKDANKRKRLPKWLKRPILANKNLATTESLISELKLNTVCHSAKCPNRGECFSKRTATFMILGDHCTRNCSFCAVTSGEPQVVDRKEPQRIAEAVKTLGLKYVVITSVTRDDLPDGGAGHFVDVINTLKSDVQNVRIEVLTPDFLGDNNAIQKVVSAGPDVFNHNIETIPRLYSEIRPQADYERSLNLLAYIKEINSKMITKSGMMLGLGETKAEVVSAMKDLRDCGCDFLTIGQYLRPSQQNYPVQEFVTPAIFDEYKAIAKDLGFRAVASGPFVRSSYHAHEFFINL